MFFSLGKSTLIQALPTQPSKPSSKTLFSSSSPFLNGSLSFSLPVQTPKPSVTAHSLSIQAVKKMQGRVVCATNDKTVSVEVFRMAPHPKYKRRVRKKKKYQAHDPENQFSVGDFVLLENCRPISKTKSFLAIPFVPRTRPPAAGEGELPLPLESQQSIL